MVKIKLTIEAIKLKMFMDAPGIYLYGKTIFLTKGLVGDSSIFCQIMGNLGAYCKDDKIDPDVDVVIVSDSIITNYERGCTKPLFFEELEKLLNKKNTPYRKLVLYSESDVIDFVKQRVKGDGKENPTKLLLDKYLPPKLKKKKKDTPSQKKPKQQSLFDI